MNYGISKKVNLEFDKIIEKVKEELKKEDFGVLTEINVKEILKKKLDKDLEDYVILGACNPSFAFKALTAEKGIGLFLPCNVIVYTKNRENYVSAINPTEAMSMVENPELKEIAIEVEKKLKKVVEAV